MNENINDNGGMFEDVQAIAMVENAEVKNLRSKLNIAEDCIQALKAELFKVEESRRNEIIQLRNEVSSLRRAFAFVNDRLYKAHKRIAGLTRWKNWFKQELTAQEWINNDLQGDNEKLTSKLVEVTNRAFPGMLNLLGAVKTVPVVNAREEMPLQLAAERE